MNKTRKEGTKKGRKEAIHGHLPPAGPIVCVKLDNDMQEGYGKERGKKESHALPLASSRTATTNWRRMKRVSMGSRKYHITAEKLCRQGRA